MKRFVYKDSHSDNIISICIINYCDLNIDTSKLLLGKSELEYFMKIKYRKVKKQFLFGRLAAKYALQNIENNLNFNDINIVKGRFNEPIIKEVHQTNLKVSISHSNNLAVALAFSNKLSCGIDVEFISESSKKITNRIMKNKEKEMLNVKIEDKTLIGIYLWTIKEALAKSIIKGLTLPLSAYTINSFYKYHDLHYGDYTNYKNYRFICCKYLDFIIAVSFSSN